METSVEIEDLKLDLETKKPLCRCCLSTENRMLDATKVGDYFMDLASIDVSFHISMLLLIFKHCLLNMLMDEISF